MFKLINYSKFLLIFLINFFIFTVCSAENLAVLNLDKILYESDAGKSMISGINTLKNKDYKSFLESEKKFKEKEKNLLAKKSVLSKEAFEKEVNSLKSSIEKYNKEKLSKVKILQQRQKKALNDFTKQITLLLKEFSEENKISILLNQKYTILVVDKVNITNQVMDKVNKKIKKIKY
jgi:outer membrane protein